MSYRRTLETDRRHLMEDFHYVHMARKVVGVGSVGTRAWILLMLGRDDQARLFLQRKECPEGGWGRQCWHAGLDSADARARRPGPAVPAGERSPGIGAGRGSSNGRLQ